MMKLSNEDRHRVTSDAEDKLIRVTSLRGLFRGDCVNQAFMVELLQRNHY